MNGQISYQELAGAAGVQLRRPDAKVAAARTAAVRRAVAEGGSGGGGRRRRGRRWRHGARRQRVARAVARSASAALGTCASEVSRKCLGSVSRGRSEPAPRRLARREAPSGTARARPRAAGRQRSAARPPRPTPARRRRRCDGNQEETAVRRAGRRRRGRQQRHRQRRRERQ